MSHRIIKEVKQLSKCIPYYSQVRKRLVDFSRELDVSLDHPGSVGGEDSQQGRPGGQGSKYFRF